VHGLLGVTLAALVGAAPAVARAAPQAPVAKWTISGGGCPSTSGAVTVTARTTLRYSPLITVTASLGGQVTDAAQLGPALAFQLKISTPGIRTLVVKEQVPTTVTTGAPAVRYTISFLAQTRAAARRKIKAAIAGAVARALREEAVLRSELLHQQTINWQSPGTCVTAVLTPNNLPVAPSSTGTTTGTLVKRGTTSAVSASWSLVSAVTGSIPNAGQPATAAATFTWNAAAAADSANHLVDVTLRATSRLGVATVRLLAVPAVQPLRHVHVTEVLHYLGTLADGTLGGQLHFDASLAYDATELAGGQGAYVLDADADWQFSNAYVTLAPSDCLAITVANIGTSSPPLLPGGSTGSVVFDAAHDAWLVTPDLTAHLGMTWQGGPATTCISLSGGLDLSFFATKPDSLFGPGDQLQWVSVPRGALQQTKSVTGSVDVTTVKFPPTIAMSAAAITYTATVTQTR
jgi:hypothetical protein